MVQRLDPDLELLREHRFDTDLTGVEAAVWGRIGQWREEHAVTAVLLPVRTAAVVGALAFGLVGGLASALSLEEQEVSAFSLEAHVAPSTLLDDRG